MNKNKSQNLECASKETPKGANASGLMEKVRAAQVAIAIAEGYPVDELEIYTKEVCQDKPLVTPFDEPARSPSRYNRDIRPLHRSKQHRPKKGPWSTWNCPPPRPSKKLTKLRRKIKKLGIDDKPEECPKWVWDMKNICLTDITGEYIKYYIDKCPHRAAAADVSKTSSAYGQYDYCGTGLDNVRARQNAVLGLTYIAIAKRDNETDDPRWGFIIEGYPQSFFQAIVKDPYSRKTPSRAILTRRRDKSPDATNGDVGYQTAYQNVGMIFVPKQKKRAPNADDHPKRIKTFKKKNGDCYSLVPDLNKYRLITDKTGENDDYELVEEIGTLVFSAQAISVSTVKEFVRPTKEFVLPKSGKDPPN